MHSPAFGGFPRGVRFTPVPSPLLGPLLEQIDDLAELKCTLRVVWLLQQKVRPPRHVTLSQLLADPVLVRALSAPMGGAAAVEAALARAVARGTLIAGATRGGEMAYALNTEGGSAAMKRLPVTAAPHAEATEPWEGPGDPNDIFALYEDNIGMLGPLIAEELREAERRYPAEWIRDAFREAVQLNKRSWRYIARILERWESEGRTDGRPGRYPEKAGQTRRTRYWSGRPASRE